MVFCLRLVTSWLSSTYNLPRLSFPSWKEGGRQGTSGSLVQAVLAESESAR